MDQYNFDIKDLNFYNINEIVEGRTSPRTNNSVEGFHWVFSDCFIGTHPPMMKFMSGTDFISNRLDYDTYFCRSAGGHPWGGPCPPLVQK